MRATQDGFSALATYRSRRHHCPASTHAESSQPSSASTRSASSSSCGTASSRSRACLHPSRSRHDGSQVGGCAPPAIACSSTERSPHHCPVHPTADQSQEPHMPSVNLDPHTPVLVGVGQSSE